jgi:hypothetical protein
MRLSVVLDRSSFHCRKIVTMSCVLAAWFASAAPASAALITVDPSETNVSVGDVFSVDILISGVSDLAEFQFVIAYDPTVLTAIDAEQGSLLAGLSTPIEFIEPDLDNIPGEFLYYDIIKPNLGISTDGSLLNVTFRADAVGTSAIFVLFDPTLFSGLFDSSGAQIEFDGTCRNDEGVESCDVVNGTVTVSAPPTTVPEPGTLLLLSSGLAATVVASRRRQRRGLSRQ